MSAKYWNIKTDKQKVLDVVSKLIDENCIECVEAKSIRVDVEVKTSTTGEMSVWCTVWDGTHNELFYAFNDAKDLLTVVHEYVEECKSNSTEYVARETERLKEQLKATKKQLKDLGVKA